MSGSVCPSGKTSTNPLLLYGEGCKLRWPGQAGPDNNALLMAQHVRHCVETLCWNQVDDTVPSERMQCYVMHMYASMASAAAKNSALLRTAVLTVKYDKMRFRHRVGHQPWPTVHCLQWLGAFNMSGICVSNLVSSKSEVPHKNTRS